MGRRVGIPLLAAALLLGVGVAGAAVFQEGNVIVNFDGDYTPHALPRERTAPITVTVEGRVRTSDGSHPPAVRQLKIELNKNGRLTTRGLPICRAASVQSSTTEAALRLCRPALVGRGSFDAALELNQEGLPAHGRVLIFNSRVRGRPGLLLHVYASVPVQATLVLPLTISRQKGLFGTVISTDVPRLAGGLGSVTRLRLKIGRSYRFRGERLSYLSASCALPPGFRSASFTLARGTFAFSNGRRLEIPVSSRCRVR